MYLKQLSLLHFKNHETSEITLDAHANAFVGSNGSGKTNVLDAIHYLSLCKSYFNPFDSQNIRNDEPYFMIQGLFSGPGGQHNVSCGLKRNQKKQFKVNQKEYERLADHIGQFPCVMIAPTDISLITDGSEERRKMMDSIISQYDKVYLDNLIHYNRIVTQRNALLKQLANNKSADFSLLDLWDEQLIPIAHAIHEKRLAFMEGFIPLVTTFYNHLTGHEEVVEIVYQSDLLNDTFLEVLQKNKEKDRALQYTSGGIHRDDLLFKINHFPVKRFGSQGQQKSFLVSLKLAQFQLLKNTTGKLPLLLLDDIFDKLDEHRVANLMQLVSNDDFGQIFITDTNAERVYGLFSEIGLEIKIFEVQAGKVQEADY